MKLIQPNFTLKENMTIYEKLYIIKSYPDLKNKISFIDKKEKSIFNKLYGNCYVTKFKFLKLNPKIIQYINLTEKDMEKIVNDWPPNLAYLTNPTENVIKKSFETIPDCYEISKKDMLNLLDIFSVLDEDYIINLIKKRKNYNFIRFIKNPSNKIIIEVLKMSDIPYITIYRNNSHLKHKSFPTVNNFSKSKIERICSLKIHLECFRVMYNEIYPYTEKEYSDFIDGKIKLELSYYLLINK